MRLKAGRCPEPRQRLAFGNRTCLIFAVVMAVAGCKKFDMGEQQKAQNWDRNTFFRNGSAMQPPAPGTVAQGSPGADVAQPPVITASMLARGREEFGIDCTPCHGRSGDGGGIIVQRGFPRPPVLWEERLRQAKAGYLYDVIGNGHGVMYGYGDRVQPADRWAVVAYLRALQARAVTKVARLDGTDLAALGASR